MDSAHPETFDTESRMKMTPREQLSLDERLDRMEYQLRRICAELDICFRAQQALLVALQQKDTAVKLGEEFEALHQTPISERDTLPPEAT